MLPLCVGLIKIYINRSWATIKLICIKHVKVSSALFLQYDQSNNKLLLEWSLVKAHIRLSDFHIMQFRWFSYQSNSFIFHTCDWQSTTQLSKTHKEKPHGNLLFLFSLRSTIPYYIIFIVILYFLSPIKDRCNY